MLRHYSEIGLLEPAEIDDSTGYRYYSEQQIPLANRIQLLKNMGFGLSSIKQILQDTKNEENLKKFLQIQLQQKQEEQHNLEKQIQLLEDALKDVEESKNPIEYSLIVKELPKRKIVSYRGFIPSFNQEGMLWSAMESETKHLDITYETPALDIAVIHESSVEGHIDVEIQKSIKAGEYQSFGNIEFREIPAILVAVLAFKGGYEFLQTINEEIAHWILKNGYELNGSIMNIYHISPKITTDEDEFVTEVCFPIKKKE